jgi:hypothetical protein
MNGIIAHTIMSVLLAALIAGLQAWAGASPGALVIQGVAVIPMLIMVLRALHLDPPAVQKEKAIASMHPPPLPLLTMAILIVCAVGLTGCALFKKAEPPLADFAVCVAGDAAQGMSVVQIAENCGGDLGRVILTLLESTEPKVQTSKAFGEAVSLKHTFAAHPELAAGR